jgi:lipopolysaccharide export system protein LptA
MLNMKSRTILLLVIIFLILFPAIAGSESANEKKITIVSDRLDAYDDKNLVLFSGSVVVTHEGIVMNSDEIYLYYKPEEKEKESTYSGLTKTGEIDRIEAKGHVKIRKEGKIATGNFATFFNDDQKIVVEGNAIMREGDNVIEGDKITFFLNENRGYVESSSNKRVTATISPDKKN